MTPDSLTYEQFKTAFLNMDIEQPYHFTQDDAFVPAMILGGTFVVNTMVMSNYSAIGLNKSGCVHLTTLIFVMGGLLSMGSYFLFR